MYHTQISQPCLVPDRQALWNRTMKIKTGAYSRPCSTLLPGLIRNTSNTSMHVPLVYAVKESKSATAALREQLATGTFN